MTTALTNGKAPRKQLSDQLDRLGTVIDPLADHLNQVVGDAARDVARQAVKDDLIDVLTDPAVRDLIRAAYAQPRASPAFLSMR